MQSIMLIRKFTEKDMFILPHEYCPTCRTMEISKKDLEYLNPMTDETS